MEITPIFSINETFLTGAGMLPNDQIAMIIINEGFDKLSNKPQQQFAYLAIYNYKSNKTQKYGLLNLHIDNAPFTSILEKMTYIKNETILLSSIYSIYTNHQTQHQILQFNLTGNIIHKFDIPTLNQQWFTPLDIAQINQSTYAILATTYRNETENLLSNEILIHNYNTNTTSIIPLKQNLISIKTSQNKLWTANEQEENNIQLRDLNGTIIKQLTINMRNFEIHQAIGDQILISKKIYTYHLSFSITALLFSPILIIPTMYLLRKKKQKTTEFETPQ